MRIRVSRRGDEFEVEVSEGSNATRHLVVANESDLARLGLGAAPERLIEATFRFLLDREPKEAILSRFNLTVVSRYFPAFERELPKYLASRE